MRDLGWSVEQNKKKDPRIRGSSHCDVAAGGKQELGVAAELSPKEAVGEQVSSLPVKEVNTRQNKTPSLLKRRGNSGTRASCASPGLRCRYLGWKSLRRSLSLEEGDARNAA